MEAGLGRGGMDAGLGRGGMAAGLGRGPPAPRPAGRCRWPPGDAERVVTGAARRRTTARPGTRSRPEPASPDDRPPGEPGRGGMAPGPGRWAGTGPPSAGGSRRGVSRCCWRAAWAALTAASCSALSAAARASAAATSMSWALAGLATGAAGCGGPGTGPFGFGAAEPARRPPGRHRLGRHPGLARRSASGSVPGRGRRRRGAPAGGGRRRSTGRRDERVTQPSGDGRLDGARRGLHELAHFLQLGENGLTLDPELFCQLVYAGLACHCTPHSEVVRAAPAATSLVHLKPGHFRDFIVCSCRSSYLACGPSPGRADRTQRLARRRARPAHRCRGHR